jgi:TatD DNase family protein
LKNFQSGGGCFVVHCFTGTPEWAEKFLELGAYIGITGIITFPRARNVRDIVKILPSDKMLIETDTPYLAPVPFRGKPNHSAYLAKTAGKVAEILGENVADTALRTTLNAFRFFGIKKKLE